MLVTSHLFNFHSTVLEFRHLRHRVECSVCQVVNPFIEVHGHVEHAWSDFISYPGNGLSFSTTAGQKNLLTLSNTKASGILIVNLDV